MKKFRNILFDMDGVLFQSSSSHAEAYKRLFQDEKMKMIPYSELAGKRTDDALRALLIEQDLDASDDHVNLLTQRKRALARDILSQRLPVTRGCEELLLELSKEYQLALASSSSDDNIKLFLKASNTGSLFKAVVSGQDVLNGKPEPDIFLLAMEKLNAKASETLIIEDSVNGVLAGVSSKATVLGLSDDNSRELLQAGASHVIGNLDELQSYLLE